VDSLSGKIFRGQILENARFLELDVPYWMAVGGVFVDAGESGCEGEGFFAQRN
jgi:hypothetical protein